LRTTLIGGSYGKPLRRQISKVGDIVETVLLEQDAQAVGTDTDSEPIFAFTNTESRLVTTSIVTTMFMKWEVARHKRGLPALLNHSDCPTSHALIIEAAAATVGAMSAIHESYPDNTINKLHLARLLGLRGPQFVRQWLNGSVLQEWLEQKNLPEDDQRVLRGSFLFGKLLSFLVDHTSDTREALDTVLQAEILRLPFGDAEARIEPVPLAADFEKMAQEAQIANAIGWSIGAVQTVTAMPIVKEAFERIPEGNHAGAFVLWVRGKVTISPEADTLMRVYAQNQGMPLDSKR